MGIAKELQITPAQLALSWLLDQGDDIFPIPGSRKIERVDENAEAIKVHLGRDVMTHIDAIAAVGTALGEALL
jgi:aryl-alcohol dehydrogenase-like predicted oxidoreductase